jgi:hypothetical protein
MTGGSLSRDSLTRWEGGALGVRRTLMEVEMHDPLAGEELEREFDRIGADQFLRGGIAVTGDIRPEEVWAAIRQAPDGSGTAGVEAALHAIVLARRAADAKS